VAGDIEISFGVQRLSKVAVCYNDFFGVIVRTGDHLTLGRHDACSSTPEDLYARR
jgi:hypothetical protein